MRVIQFAYRLLLCMFLLFFYGQISNADGIEYTDSCKATIHNYRCFDQYNYGPDKHFEPLNSETEKSNILDNIIGNDTEIIKYVLYAFVGLIVLVILRIILKNTNWHSFVAWFRKLFNRLCNIFKRKKGIALDNDQENINNIKFEERINQALEVTNYKEAIRITYLNALYILDNKKYIIWDSAKNATEYYYEITKSKNIKRLFRELINIYLKARYDDIIVEQEMFDNAQLRVKQIMKEMEAKQ